MKHDLVDKDGNPVTWNELHKMCQVDIIDRGIGLKCKNQN